MTCDQTTHMHRLHDGETPPAERSALQAHVASCPECAGLLAELRGITRLVSQASAMPLPNGLMARLQNRVSRSEERAVFRVASGLTAAAAAILLAVLLTWPADGTTERSAQPAIWQSLAVTNSAEHYEEDSEMLVLAQWMADDLASAHNGELR